MKLKRLLFVSSCLILATAGIMTETTGTTTGTIGGGTTTPLKPKEPQNGQTQSSVGSGGGGCGYYRLRNYKENAKFAICSPYKDYYKLRRALLAGIKPEFA